MGIFSNSQSTLIDQVIQFLENAEGLGFEWVDESELVVKQFTDGKNIPVKRDDLKEVFVREDSGGRPFIQVNFLNGTKILLTENLIGFKPHPTSGLDLRKLPKVVTTPDLLSVFEATEEAISDEADRVEVDTLKQVFEAILIGGEAVGFDLEEEKAWFRRLTAFNATA